MRARAAAVGAMVLALRSAYAAPDAPASSLAVRYANGRLSVDVDRAPLDQVLAAVVRETGAPIEGTVRDWRLVSKRFENLSLPEALDRLLGAQNFTVIYGPRGRPRRILLEGLTVAPPQGRVPVTGVALQRLLAAHPPIPVPEELRGVVPGSTTTLGQLLLVAGTNPDARARATAATVIMRQVESVPAVRAALRQIDADGLARFAKRVAPANPAELLQQLSSAARDTLVRARLLGAHTALLRPRPPTPSRSPLQSVGGSRPIG